MIMLAKFIFFINLYYSGVVGDINHNKAGIVSDWTRPDEGLVIDFQKQKEYIEELPKPVSYEVTTTTLKFIVNCQVYKWKWIWSPEAHYEYIFRVELLTSKDKVRYESLITYSCDENEVRMSIAPYEKRYNEGLKSLLKPVFMVFMDQGGGCYERSYDIDTSFEYTATVTRSSIEQVDCPPDMLKNLEKRPVRENRQPWEKEYKGVVMDLTPEGKELLTDYIRNSVEEEVVFTIPYHDNYRLECRKTTLPGGIFYSGVVISGGESTLFLDRLKFTSCDEQKLKDTFSFSSNNDEIYIDFMTSGSLCYRRTCEIQKYNRNNYKYVRVVKINPYVAACPRP